MGLIGAILLTVGLGVYDYAVIQAAEKKVEQIAEKEMPLLIAEKGLAAAGETAVNCFQGFLESNGAELDKTQFQKQAAIMAYQLDDVERLTVSEELHVLLEQNRVWLALAEKEIMNATEEGLKGEELAQKAEAANKQVKEIQAGYQEQIAAQNHVIQELEQEVVTSEKTSHFLIGMMSLILTAAFISASFMLRKILTLKVTNVSNVA